MKIRSKINFSFLSVLVFILAIIGAFVGLYSVSIVKNKIDSYLVSSNRARAEHIRTFLQDKINLSEIMAASAVYRDLLNEPVNSSNYKNLKIKVEDRLQRSARSDTQIIETLIIDKNGKVVASSDPENEGEDESKDDYFIEGQKKTFIKDVYYLPEMTKTTYAISSPIKDINGELLGVSVLRYSSDGFYAIVKNENGLGHTEENFLVNKNKFFITPSLFLGEGVILKQKVETENVNSCFSQKEMDYVNKNGYSGLIKTLGTNITEAKDYRNVDVMATHSYIPETGWCLITKADKSELLSFRWALSFFNFFVLIGGMLIFLLLSVFISKKITNPISSLIIKAEKIEKGDFDYKLDINSQDEIGDLSKSFDKMSEALKISRTNIENKVAEQTRELSVKSKDLEEQKSAILNILEDVEKQKINAESLANDLVKFKLALENASDQVVITDVEGVVIYGNSAVEKITGFTAKEAIGKKAAALWRMPMPLDYYKNMWDVIKNQKKVFKGEIQNKRKNGEIYTASISISPVLDENKNVIYFVAIEHDITKEKEVDKAKTEFVSLASHQLRTPLSSINWYTEMLLAGDAGAINEEQKKYLQEVAIGNQRMVDLVNSLLNVSRLDLGTFMIEPEPTNVSEMAKSVLDELKSQIMEKKIKIEESYNGDLSKFNADQKLLRIVFQNLLSNAVKYTAPEGSVKINVSILEKGKTFGGKEFGSDSLIISVTDSGMGVPAGQRDKIFSKLFRADNARESETEGTGLGLYIVKSIIDQSGGEVWFESIEKQGTTFYIALPLSGMKRKEGSKKLD